MDRLPGGPVVLVTGVAGFIGFHLANRLASDGYRVVGLDNVNTYYDVRLKWDRLALLRKLDDFEFIEMDIADQEPLRDVFDAHRPEVVVNLAAQAGVRYSLENPHAYVQSNLVGFTNVLEACRHSGVQHLLYASSSSVYGGNEKVPFSESDPVNHPISLYAATKRSNELMADCYAHLFKIPATGLRFFTVYGPYGRPDMAYFSFTKRYFDGLPIHVYSGARTIMRDFTYIDDVVESVARIISMHPRGERPHRVLNVGGSQPIALQDFIAQLEASLGDSLGKTVQFEKVLAAQKPGDVPVTSADTSALEALCQYQPATELSDGLRQFTDWYVDYFGQAAVATGCTPARAPDLPLPSSVLGDAQQVQDS